ncbi:MAG TPA: VOC family protein [Candidatus Saccharibacteria bacterium]|nr:VOC family protein [Candidatus Saccharibacteria bacterium]HRK94544.1 VOC family protein [Candidatus Saccharibacteria bacterium]
MFKQANAFSGFSVDDLEEAKVFYADLLGIQVDDSGMGLELQFPNGHSVFIYEKEDHQPATYTTLNFPVNDINAAIDSMLEQGITMQRYDNLPAKQDERGVLRGKSAGMGPDIAWFEDPAGNILAVLEN